MFSFNKKYGHTEIIVILNFGIENKYCKYWHSTHPYRIVFFVGFTYVTRTLAACDQLIIDPVEDWGWSLSLI